MSENLGLLLGVLGFGFLLYSVDRNKIWPIFGALVLFALGSAARPGALFILPALVLYAGIRVWKTSPGRLRAFAAMGALLLGLALTVGCFGSNQLFLSTFFRGEGKPFGNFAFTLHGLLNDTKWSTSYEAYDGNAPLVMEQNIKQLKESPGSLIRGMERAYRETLKKGFLFRFGEEKRLASSGMAMFCCATLACWLWPPLRRDAGWILLVVAGILASIPFAPPWDAGERPYAVTEPIQIFLAAAGFSLLIDLVRKLANTFVLGARPAFFKQPTETLTIGPEGAAQARGMTGLFSLAILCLVLVLPAPLLLKGMDKSPSMASQTPIFHSGSYLLISQEGTSRPGYLSRSDYLSRLSDFQAQYPDRAKFFTSQSADFLLTINWQDLQTILVSPPPKDL